MSGRMSRPDSFRAGVAAIAPILIGVVPFGLIYGVAAVESGLDTLPAVAMSAIVFAGAAQLAIVDLAGRDATLAVMVATALVINARMLMYSASLAPHLRDTSLPNRLLGGYLITDQAYAVTITRFADSEEVDRWAFFFGASMPLWVVWQVSTVIGVLVGASIPGEWSLDFAIPLVFLALLVPIVKERGTRVAVGVGGTVAVIASPLAFNAGLITGAIAGLVAGMLAEGRS